MAKIRSRYYHWMYYFSNSIHTGYEYGNDTKIIHRRGYFDDTLTESFCGDITLLMKNFDAAKAVLERLEDLIKWSRMKFKAKKSGSCTTSDGKQKEVRFTIAGENILTVKEEPVKSLGRWYKETLTVRYKGIEIYNQTQEGLRSIDKD